LNGITKLYAVLLLIPISCTCNLDKPVTEVLAKHYRTKLLRQQTDNVNRDIKGYVTDLSGCNDFDPEAIALDPAVPSGTWSTESLMCFSVSKKLTDKHKSGSPNTWGCKKLVGLEDLVKVCKAM